MNHISEKFEKIVSEYPIAKENVLFGCNKPKVNEIKPSMRGVKVRFDELQYFFFYFNEEGITLFPLNEDGCALLPWENVVDFNFKSVLLGCKMTVKTNNETYKFEISNKPSGCPWQKENIAHLKEINCCYTK